MFENLDINHLLATYGYWAILALTFLEGETIVIIAGFLASRGRMNPFLIALCAFCGSSLSDQLMFSLGKYKGPAVINRFPTMQKNVWRASKLINKYENYLILGFRFVYGVRNVTPILLGISQVSHLKFLVLNILGAAIWSISFTAGGYYMGNFFLHLAETVGQTAAYVVGGIILVLVVIFFVRKRLSIKKERELEAAERRKGYTEETTTEAKTDTPPEE